LEVFVEVDGHFEDELLVKGDFSRERKYCLLQQPNPPVLLVPLVGFVFPQGFSE
jgi:hypothetical protein